MEAGPINTQVAPYPHELEALVLSLSYRPGWRFALGHVDRHQGSEGLTLTVITSVVDTYDPEAPMRVLHYFPVPPAAFNEQSWMRWLLDCLLEVETHEACEFFQIGQARPFAPNHGPGWDPYIIRELNTAEAAETSFKGERDKGSQG